MEVTKTRFEDAGEQDENGDYDYYYAGYVFRFVFGQEALVVRQYDASDEAGFLTREIKGKRKWKSEPFDGIPYESLAFQEAVQYLVEVERVHRVTLLLEDYVPVHLPGPA